MSVLDLLLEDFNPGEHRGFHGRWIGTSSGKVLRIFHGQASLGDVPAADASGSGVSRVVRDAGRTISTKDAQAVVAHAAGSPASTPRVIPKGGSANELAGGIPFVHGVGPEGQRARARGASSMATEHADTRDKLTNLPQGQSYGLHGPRGQVGRVDRTKRGWEVHRGANEPKVHKTPSSAAGEAMRIQRTAASSAEQADVMMRNYRHAQEVAGMNARQAQRAQAELRRAELLAAPNEVRSDEMASGPLSPPPPRPTGPSEASQAAARLQADLLAQGWTHDATGRLVAPGRLREPSVSTAAKVNHRVVGGASIASAAAHAQRERAEILAKSSNLPEPPASRHGGFGVGDHVGYRTPSIVNGTVEGYGSPQVGTVSGLQRNGYLRVREPVHGTTVDVHHSNATAIPSSSFQALTGSSSRARGAAQVTLERMVKVPRPRIREEAEPEVLDALLSERFVSADKRSELVQKGHALPGGVFPIETKRDAENAKKLYLSGHHKTPAAKKHIIRNARRVGALGVVQTLADTDNDGDAGTGKDADNDGD